MVDVGLTGGIGSGKTAASDLLASWGAVLVDADVVAREVVEPGTPGLDRVVAEFGGGVLTATGELDRDALGEIVFADPGARRRLNEIIHPLVAARSRALSAAAPSGSIVVHAVPLLVEADLGERYDLVVVVDVDEGVQLDRLTRLRGMSESAARARIGAQADRRTRRAAADVVIDNSGSRADLEAQLRRLWEQLAARAGGPLARSQTPPAD